MTLKPKQQAAVNKAPQHLKQQLRQQYTKQNQENACLVKTTIAKPPTPKKKAKQMQKIGPKLPRNLAFAFDAFDYRHMPLDETTAPYTVSNLMGVMDFTTSTTLDYVIVVGLHVKNIQETWAHAMTDFIAMQYDAAQLTGSQSTINHLRSNVINAPTQTAGIQYCSVRARLHNMSVRLTCLGNGAGLYPVGNVYIGAVPMIEGGQESSAAAGAVPMKTAWATDSIAVGLIKSFPAAKLVNHPVTVHSAVAENISYKTWRDFQVPEANFGIGNMPLLTSLEPIVLYVPRTASQVDYKIEVGEQWCTRHPNNIMMRATQRQHTATPQPLWQQAIASVKDVGSSILGQVGDAAASAAGQYIGNKFAQATSPAGQIMAFGHPVPAW